MPKWNMFSEEVRKECRTVMAYGVDRVNDTQPLTTYKAQALRELAMRLVLAEELKNAKADINKLIDALEAAEVEVPDLS